MLISEVPGKLRVEWIEDAHAIWDKWLNYAVTFSEFREAIVDKAVPFGKSHGAIARIADASDAKGVFPQEVQDYIAKEVFKIFVDNGIQYFISVQPKNALTKLTVMRYQTQVGPHGMKMVEAQTFESALAFLKDAGKQTG